MTPRQAVAYVRRHGVVLESAKGWEPTFVAAVAGEPIGGSWWGHRLGHEIHALTQYLRRSKVILVCTLANGRITYVHKRLWSAFVRRADAFPARALARVREVHTKTGHHGREDIAFPVWVPAPVLAAAKSLSRHEARTLIQVWLQRYGAA